MKALLRLWTDSSAAMGTAGRQGLGKLRHLECHSLWLQQRSRRNEFKLLKVPGESNPADLFTKHSESMRKLDELLKLFNRQVRDGRPAAAPSLKTTSAVAACHLVQGQPRHEQAQGPWPRTGEAAEKLPHLHSESFIRTHLLHAVPMPELYGEPDPVPEEGLQDPMPVLARSDRIRPEVINRTTSCANRKRRDETYLAGEYSE